MPELIEIVAFAQKRLDEYREKRRNEHISIHIISFEIAICLVEFSLNTSPARPILKAEEQWFEAGWLIQLILENSPFADMIDLYYQIVEATEKRKLFPATSFMRSCLKHCV